MFGDYAFGGFASEFPRKGAQTQRLKPLYSRVVNL